MIHPIVAARALSKMVVTERIVLAVNYEPNWDSLRRTYVLRALKGFAHRAPGMELDPAHFRLEFTESNSGMIAETVWDGGRVRRAQILGGSADGFEFTLPVVESPQWLIALPLADDPLARVIPPFLQANVDGPRVVSTEVPVCTKDGPGVCPAGLVPLTCTGWNDRGWWVYSAGRPVC